ncbi:lactococcin family bacteriocin [Lactococcus hircilactis]
MENQLNFETVSDEKLTEVIGGHVETFEDAWWPNGGFGDAGNGIFIN